MKNIILLLLFVQQISFCQSENSIFPALPYTELSQVAVADNYIYTAGDCNTALVSKDAGDNWITIATEDIARNIRIVPNSNGEKAIYQYKTEIYIFDINTLEFEEISSSSLFLSSGNFQSIELEGNNIFVISNQNIHKATVGTYDWEKVADFNFDNDAVQVTDITENYIHISTLNGELLRLKLSSNDVESMNDFENRIYSFDMINDNLGYFTIQNFTYPIKTTDGGQTYTQLEELPENIGVTGYGEDIILTVNTNRIYVSTDGGASSTYIPIPDDGTYDLIYSSFITDDGVIYFAGRSSMILKTENFGQSFINLNDYKREHLNKIDMHSSGTGIAVGGKSSIVKTEDGGENWELKDIEFGGENNYLNSVAILDQNKYIVAGSDALVIVENDEITHTVERGLNFMHYNAAEGYIIGLQSSNSDYSIVKSSDGGMTWENKAFLPGYSSEISQSPSGKIYIPSQDGVIYTSTDGGDTWDIENFGEDIEVRSIKYLDENIGLASTGLKLYRTMDGGETASLVSSGYNIRNIQYVSEEHILYFTSNESQTNIYESKNGGDSFTEVKEHCSETLSTYTDENNLVWMAQKGGHINKYQIEPLTSTFDIENSPATVYPNPISVNQELTIESDEPLSEAILSSMTSSTIVRLVPTQANTVSIGDLNPGMYMLSIKTQKGKESHARLVVVK